MTAPQLMGLGLIAVIMLAAIAIGLRKQPRAIKLFALALCLVGLGYLSTTTAPTEIVRTVFGEQY